MKLVDSFTFLSFCALKILAARVAILDEKDYCQVEPFLAEQTAARYE